MKSNDSKTNKLIIGYGVHLNNTRIRRHQPVYSLYGVQNIKYCSCNTLVQLTIYISLDKMKTIYLLFQRRVAIRLNVKSNEQLDSFYKKLEKD